MGEIRPTKTGRNIYLDGVEVWWNKLGGSINLTFKADGMKDQFITVSHDENSATGHPRLFKMLRDCLKQVDAEYPPGE